MTLYRQLIIFTFALFLLLFAGTWYAKLDSTRSFLVDQLESHSQDTATSLGLSLSQYVFENDMPIVESMINAVFDRGYYRVIRLIDVKKNVLAERTLDLKIENVPAWFVRLIPLKTPEAAAKVMSGWKEAGTVLVSSHPGYAYKTLWEDMVRTTLWFLACAVFVLIVGGFSLRVLLKPLTRVERQADALCRKEYEIQEHLPWTKELRRVVEAMNRMTVKVKEMFEEQVVHADGLRERAYHDSVTGLGNRRYFDSQITARLDRRDSVTKGVLLLLKLNELEKLNQQKGFQAGDDLLKRVASLLQENTSSYANCVLARLTGGDFGIFLPDAPLSDAETIAAGMAKNLGSLAAEQLSISDNIGNVGAAAYDCNTTPGRLLSEADTALNAAKQMGPNMWSIRTITEETDKTPLGQQHWKEMLEKALRERRISLDAQRVVRTSDKNSVVHLEIFSRIVEEDGKFLSAGIFMPLAERLKLVSILDRIVLEKVMHLDRNQLGIDSIAVNVSPASLQDDDFRLWVPSALKKLPPSAPRILFEFSEYGAIQNSNLLKDFSTAVRECGHMMGLDHYGQSFSKLGYLQSLRPDYVKVDRAYTGELKDEESDSRFFIGSLVSVAHSIDVEVMAEGVETEQQWQILKKMNIDAIQGYIIDRPKPITEQFRGV